jgi:hypothetical protein
MCRHSRRFVTFPCSPRFRLDVVFSDAPRRKCSARIPLSSNAFLHSQHFFNSRIFRAGESTVENTLEFPHACICFDLRGLVMVARSCSLVHPHTTQRRPERRGETATPYVASSLAAGVSSIGTHIPITNKFPGLSLPTAGPCFPVYLSYPALDERKSRLSFVKAISKGNFQWRQGQQNAW